MAENPGQTLTVNNVLGIVQRLTMELHTYMAQAPVAVDRAVCMAYLENAASWVAQLPPGATEEAANANQAEGKQAKAS